MNAIINCLLKFVWLATSTLYLVGSQSVTAQVQQAWVVHYNNGIANSTNQVVKMVLDSSGNVYVTGLSQNVNINLGYATLKIAPNGSQIWTERFDSTNYPGATPSAMALDSSNDVILTGSAATLEYNSNGVLLWTNSYNAAGVAVDSTNNVYITGVSSNFETMKLNSFGSNAWTVTDVGTVPGSANIALAIAVDSGANSYVAGDETYEPTNQSSGFDTLAIIKYDPSGNLLWRFRTVTNDGEAASFMSIAGLTTDSQSNLYVAEGFGEGGGTPYFTAKFTSSGSLVWVNGNPNENGSSVAFGFLLDSIGNVVITGKAGHFPNGTYGTYKINTSGAYVQTNFFPSSPINSSAALAVAVDSANNYCVTGFSPGTNGYNDIVTIKYNASGGQVWLQRYSSPVPDNAAGNAIAVDANFNVYVAGYDTGPGGGTEMVVIKYSPVTLQVLSNGTVQLQAQGTAGELFDVQASSDLQTWQDLGQSAADTNGLFQFDDTNAPNYPARFYFTLPQ
jgi:hypothetical protein